MECHQDINARDPLLWPLLALRMLACAYPGNAVPGRYIIDYAARQVSGRSVNLLPWFVRSRAGLRAIRHQADEGYCPCLQWSCTSFRWASEGRYRPYPPIDQRVCHRHRWRPSYTAMSILPLKRRTDSAPAPPGASGAFALEREYGFRWAL